MSDLYTRIANSGVGRAIFGAIKLPLPQILERHESGMPFFKGNILLGGTAGGTAIATAVKTLPDGEASLLVTNGNGANEEINTQASSLNINVSDYSPSKEDQQQFKGLVFDATGISTSDELKEMFRFFQPVIRKLQACGRVVVLGRTPELCETPRQQTAQRALEGFTRTVGKELTKGASCQLIYIAPGAEANAEPAIRFFLSPKSAYVTGQVVRVTKGGIAETDWDKPLTGKNALVTGGSRGIGEAIANTLARDGANVVVLDIEPMEEELRKVAKNLKGDFLIADVTADNAAELIAEKFSPMGGLDVLVHNAGVTRDKTLGGMTEQLWDMVLNFNLISV